jgi:hypothetical protein
MGSALLAGVDAGAWGVDEDAWQAASAAAANSEIGDCMTATLTVSRAGWK